jgi:hypothetical protein
MPDEIYSELATSPMLSVAVGRGWTSGWPANAVGKCRNRQAVALPWYCGMLARPSGPKSAYIEELPQAAASKTPPARAVRVSTTTATNCARVTA